MKQAIAGVTPAKQGEVTSQIVWPSVAMYGLAKMLGQLYAIPVGIYVVTIGNIIALLTAPIGLALYFLRIAPVIGIRYRLTNRRLLVERGIYHKPDRWVDLDRYDAIDIVVQPGQAWYHAGDLIFRKGNVETFRIEGVSRPAAFRAACLKASQAYVGVQKAMARQPAMA